jgi:hypothetical protein
LGEYFGKEWEEFRCLRDVFLLVRQGVSTARFSWSRESKPSWDKDVVRGTVMA